MDARKVVNVVAELSKDEVERFEWLVDTLNDGIIDDVLKEKLLRELVKFKDNLVKPIK